MADSVSSTRGWLVRTFLLTLVCGALPRLLLAQTVDSTTWCLGPGDRVFAIARHQSTLYLGGNFASIGPATGGGVEIGLPSSDLIHDAQRVAGQVYAVAADGAGGWFIGGAFSAVGGHVHANLAHLTSGGVDDFWSPVTNGAVRSLARSGQTLYVGGDFDSVSSMPRPYLAAIDVGSGTLFNWSPAPDYRVSSILPVNGTVYIGGQFGSVGGVMHQSIAAIDSALGTTWAWDPMLDGEVLTLGIRDTTLFLGGRFTSVGGTPRPYLAAVGAVSGLLADWDAGVKRTPIYVYDGGPRVATLIMRDSTMFVAGSFKVIGGAAREGLAEVSLVTAAATAWNPLSHSALTTGAYYTSLALAGDTLFVAGEADSLGGQPSSYLACVNAQTAARLDWDPRPNWEISALAVQGSTLYAGGRFTSVGSWVARHNLAAIDLTNGSVLPWAPEADDYVNALLVSKNTVYAGGVFSFAGGQSRSGLAALDRLTGAATSWNPGVTGSVDALVLHQGVLLVGGRFSDCGGQPRANVAALDTLTGLATPWNPSASDEITCLLDGDSVIYVGGSFASVGGQPRQTLAALDPSSGAPSPWAPSTDGYVYTLAGLNGTVFVGGDFNFVNGIQRDAVAGLDARGELTPFVANASRRVLTMTAADSTVYIGGGFDMVGGVPRQCVAALDAGSGRVRDWDPEPDGVVWSLDADGPDVFVGGAFTRIGRWPQASMARVGAAKSPQVTSPELWLSQNAPNPCRISTAIAFELPTAAAVRLDVFDLQGRRVAILLDETQLSAGPHRVDVTTGNWPAGCYFYRLRTLGRSMTRKMVVLG